MLTLLVLVMQGTPFLPKMEYLTVPNHNVQESCLSSHDILLFSLRITLLTR